MAANTRKLTFQLGAALGAFTSALAGCSGLPAVAVAQERPMPFLRNVVAVGGRERGYLYHVPANYRPDGYNFIVYVAPDDGQDPDAFARESGWLRLSDDKGFVLVVLQPDREGWARNSGGEDAYIKTVYDDVFGHLAPPAGLPASRGAPADGERPMANGGMRGRGGMGPGAGRPLDSRGVAPAEQLGTPGTRRQALEPGAVPGNGPPARGEGAEGAGARGGRGPRVSTWVPFHYITGNGMGATVAQEFVINNPGVFAAIATVGGAPFDAAYAKGAEAAQGYFQQMRPGKNAQPVWKQLKRDVPVAAWVVTQGDPAPAWTKLVDYWKHSSGVAPAPSSQTIDGLPVRVFRNSSNPAQQIRMTQLPLSAAYDASLSSALWNDFFAHTARWSSSANGDLGTMMTEAEVRSAFQVRTIDINGKTYTYYVKLPSSYRKGSALPVVINAHGAFYPTWLYASQIKMHEVGEREGFITVYVNGQQNRWDFTDPDGDDAKYILAVVHELISNFGADPSRVYLQGFSLGSGVSYMMGITHPDVFAAVAPNNGIGPMTPKVEQRVAELKAKGDVRIPMMIFYGDVDTAGSTDAKIPATGVLRGAIDEVKAYNHITASDHIQPYNSPNTFTYDVLVPGGKPVRWGVDSRFRTGRFQVSEYASADPRPLNLFNFVWVTDLSHGQDPRTAQIEWDYFKHWRRTPDGALSYDPR